MTLVRAIVYSPALELAFDGSICSNPTKKRPHQGVLSGCWYKKISSEQLRNDEIMGVMIIVITTIVFFATCDLSKYGSVFDYRYTGVLEALGLIILFKVLSKETKSLSLKQRLNINEWPAASSYWQYF